MTVNPLMTTISLSRIISDLIVLGEIHLKALVYETKYVIKFSINEEKWNGSVYTRILK